ncbi:MAG: hypothetical protein H6665_13615 [Ardenticatenaceae bacterium]|nr:hypothetical protein [Ardenticatenaceae bacterium]
MTMYQPYEEFKPGQLIAAEIINHMQGLIRADIAEQSQAAVDAIAQVPSAQDAERLEGRSLADIAKAIVEEAISQMALRSGYVRLYKKLQVGEEMVVEHKLHNCPLVDLYQLDYFQVVASEDDYKYLTWVNFFLYHSSEKRIRFVPEGGNAPVSVEIEPTDGEAYRVSFAQLLSLYKVEYTDNSSLGEIENELWDAMFAAPNDRFDDQQYAHSPWFDRCCREERTVRSLKQRGDWDDMWIKLVPRKTVNYRGGGEDDNGNSIPTAAPTMVQVSHFSFNKLGLTLLQAPVYSSNVLSGLREEGRDLEAIQQELKLMVLLRA